MGIIDITKPKTISSVFKVRRPGIVNAWNRDKLMKVDTGTGVEEGLMGLNRKIRMTWFEIAGMALKIKIRVWKIGDGVGIESQKRRIIDRGILVKNGRIPKFVRGHEHMWQGIKFNRGKFLHVQVRKSMFY